MAMKLTTQTRPVIKRLAELTDADIAKIALDAGEAAFLSLVANDVVIGANGNPKALHMRVGRAVTTGDGLGEQFEEWGSRTLENGHEFAKNTGQKGKAGTAAEYKQGSGDAFTQYGKQVGEGPRQYTGADYIEVIVTDSNDPAGYKYLDGVVGVASGAQGLIDWVPSAAAGRTLSGLVQLRDEARALLVADQVPVPAEDATVTEPSVEPADDTDELYQAIGLDKL